MKKSQLRKIIRESIKELMTEQASVYTKCKYNKCSGGGFGWQYMKINGQTPVAGNIFMIGNTAFHTYVCWPNDTSNSGGDYDCASNSGIQQGDCPNCESMSTGGITGGGSVYPPYTCNYGCPAGIPCTTYGCTDPTAMNYNSTILPNCDQGCVYAYQLGCTDSTASNYDPAAIYDDGSCILGNAGCPTCDSSAWGNHQNWITQFTSMPHFSSSNPNQPCNMICNKIQIWDNNCQNAGPVQANQLACKIEEAQNQSQIHGCNC